MAEPYEMMNRPTAPEEPPLRFFSSIGVVVETVITEVLREHVEGFHAHDEPALHVSVRAMQLLLQEHERRFHGVPIE
jgi:hypothetical protein